MMVNYNWANIVIWIDVFEQHYQVCFFIIIYCNNHDSIF